MATHSLFMENSTADRGPQHCHSHGVTKLSLWLSNWAYQTIRKCNIEQVPKVLYASFLIGKSYFNNAFHLATHLGECPFQYIELCNTHIHTHTRLLNQSLSIYFTSFFVIANILMVNIFKQGEKSRACFIGCCDKQINSYKTFRTVHGT